MSWKGFRSAGILVCLVSIVLLLSVQFLSRSVAPATVEAQDAIPAPLKFLGRTGPLLLYSYRDEEAGVTCWTTANASGGGVGISCVPDQPDVQAIVEQLFQARLFMYIGFSDPPASEP